MSSLIKFNTKDFIPLQPGFENDTSYYVEYKEKNYIDGSTILFYQFKINEELGDSMSVIPDGCLDILFCCNSQEPFANICGSVLEYKTIQLQPSYDYFGVRFLPNQEIKYSKYSIKEMIENEVPLNDMITLDKTIIWKIIQEKDFTGRIKLFKEMIGNVLFARSTSTSIIRYALIKMYSAKGNININQLAKEMGYSSRYLRKQFEESVGISPKLFSQIIRFQSSLYMLLKTNGYSIWDVINENGYYDQAHFINEFKKFSYLTPNKLISQISKNVV